MEIKKSKILSAKTLIRTIRESNKSGERFCFILGAGASVESGIPSGNTLEMRWMNCIMGEAEDCGTLPMDAGERQQRAEALLDDGKLEHPFTEIKDAWQQAKANNKSIDSKYYFDIYTLRFDPNPRLGYRYLEQLMEKCEPSLGYHTLALMLAEPGKNNLVITTNFDSLVEDALFLYTDTRPLVVGHESLAGYIDANIKRPIVAKVHRGLMYAPLNSPDTTQSLKDGWSDALDTVLNNYTPIVIGYGGGDHSLMPYLEKSSSMRHGVYWCYREADGLPEAENIQAFIAAKNDRYFVSIQGFDAFMMELGNALYENAITPTQTENYLKKRCESRINKYNEQWEKLQKKPGLEPVLAPMNKAEQEEEEKREQSGSLTAWDYIRRGNRADDDGNYPEAIEAYTKAIEVDSNCADAFNNRGVAYNHLGQYEKALEDFSKAIALDPNYAFAFNNRGIAYDNLGQYEKAIEDYSKAIALEPNYADAFNNRGVAYDDSGQYEKAIEDYSKVIALDPNHAAAFNNRGNAYNHLGQYEKALEDCSTSIALNPNNAAAFDTFGDIYKGLGQYENALENYSKAIELNPNAEPLFYANRAEVYRLLGKNDLAEKDEKRAAELKAASATP